MMLAEDKAILQDLTQRIRERYPEARIWAFGSRARGDATWESDFDTFIVLSEKDSEADSAIRDLCWEVGFENGRVITFVVMDRRQFEEGPMSESTLVESVLREGIAA